METRVTLVKRALVRDSSIPQGQPSPLYIECHGNRLSVDLCFPGSPIGGVVCPDCGTIYDGGGLVLGKR